MNWRSHYLFNKSLLAARHLDSVKFFEINENGIQERNTITLNLRHTVPEYLKRILFKKYNRVLYFICFLKLIVKENKLIGIEWGNKSLKEMDYFYCSSEAPKLKINSILYHFNTNVILVRNVNVNGR